MLCVLGRDAAELLGLQRDFHGFANLRAAVVLQCLVQQDLGFGVLYFFHNVFNNRDIVFRGDGVNVDKRVVNAAEVVLDRNRKRGFDLIEHIIGGDALLLFKKLQRFKKFGVHFF